MAFAGGPEGFIALPQVVTPPLSNNAAPIGPNRPLLDKVDEKSAFVPNRIILKFKDSSWAQGFVYGKGTANPAIRANTLQLSAENQNALSQVGARVVKAMPGMGVMVVEIAEHNKRSLGRAIETLYRSGAIEYAHPDFIVKTQKTPNDTDFGVLWGLHNTGQTGGVADADIDAPEAWNKRIGSRGSVVVGVIDSGVDYTHPDLKPNMWANPGEIPGNGIDDEGNGYIDDVYGIDAYNADTDPMDDNGHGTHVSGTIGARGNNNSQVVGVNWTADIMALKFLGASGSGSTSDAITLIDYAIDTKARYAMPRMVLNNSWGGGGFSPALEAAIAASRDNGILFVAAAGNDNTDNDVFPHYPSSYDVDNIVSVGSTDAMDYRSWFSNYGCSSVDIFAPGSDILSTVPGGGLALYSGTSMATPHVAGAAALLWAQNPSFTWRNVKAALINGADIKPALNEHSINGSRLNVNNSMTNSVGAAPSLWAVSPAVAGPGEDVIIKGNRFGTSAGSVLIRGVSVPIKKWTNTAITVTLPSDMNYGAGKVIVTDATGIATKGACFQVSSQAKAVDATLIPRAWHAGAKVGNDYWIFGGETHWGATALVELYTPGTGKK
ncbi:MAG: S8 family serine peptidase, partial [Burkholderiaceae bacterium]|nr:S8 family serine peptidase [Burkholderiaceae bacterium]